MTTRHFAPLLVGTAALVLVIGSLFTGGTTSAAGKGDRTAPTTPTNLSASNITTTSVTLSWTGSTDNSGSLSYKVRITNLKNSAYNSLATISQSQTTYTARFLATNSSYTFAVYAVDAAGNKSSDSNVVSASTLADTTPPSAPTLTATVLTPSQVQLTWNTPTDNVTNNCCNYSVNLNGSNYTGNLNWVAAPAVSMSLTFRHLTPATTYSFSISVSDWSGGNVSTSNTVSATTQPSNDITPPSAPTNLSLVHDDSCGEIWLGWGEATDNSDPQNDIEYEIYVNGVLSPLPVSAGTSVDFVYATNHGDNYFQVKAVDRSGNTSASSNLLILYLWPC
jgi:fibronectin type 3 domain-containing protein